MELLNIKQAPNNEQIPLLIKDKDGELMLNDHGNDDDTDLNILAVTWNMG